MASNLTREIAIRLIKGQEGVFYEDTNWALGAGYAVWRYSFCLIRSGLRTVIPQPNMALYTSPRFGARIYHMVVDFRISETDKK
ncbi:MAG TPA: hypothetical protein VN441_15345 [Syntrophomonas sp.]|nr:hypothetical protein [Syntrophomonas sp.]